MSEKAPKNMCNNEMEDGEIITIVQDGNTECFDLIIERYDQKLFYYVMRFVRNSDEAHDIVQNVFVKSLKHIDSFDSDRKFSSWIYRIAHNETMNWLTRSSSRRQISIDDEEGAKYYTEISDTTSSALNEWFTIELRDDLHEAVSKLPENYAEVINLHYFEDKSYKEISKIIGKPTSSVGTLLRRAKKRLLKIVLESNKI